MPNTKKTAVDRDSKKTINLKPIVDGTLAYLALILLAGFAYEGITNLVEAKPLVQTAIAVLVVLLLLKTALKR